MILTREILKHLKTADHILVTFNEDAQVSIVEKLKNGTYYSEEFDTTTLPNQVGKWPVNNYDHVKTVYSLLKIGDKLRFYVLDNAHHKHHEINYIFHELHLNVIRYKSDGTTISHNMDYFLDTQCIPANFIKNMSSI